MAKINFISGGAELFQRELLQSQENLQKAVEEGAGLLKQITYNKGKSMGVHRTGQTLGSMTVKSPKRQNDGWACYITYNGRNKKGNRNAEVAFINEYGKRGQPARAFNRLAVETGEEAVIRQMEDTLLKDE